MDQPLSRVLVHVFEFTQIFYNLRIVIIKPTWLEAGYYHILLIYIDIGIFPNP